MIVVVGGTKGGSGKSTVATNLAIMLAASGQDVLLVDADDQETSTDFTNLREASRPDGAGYTCVALTGAAVRSGVQRLAPKHAHVIIDTGGRDTVSQRAALSICDVYLVPFAPRSFDVWTLDKVAELVEEARVINPGLRALAFINRADARGNENAEAAELIQGKPGLEFVPASLGTRKAFAHAAASGMSVTELRPQDPKAVEEIGALYRHLFDIPQASAAHP
ncbi:AAA family ATPase [Methylobacterium radiotolerans]|uniref:Cobyrinic acid ac-diamide synthase n=1 Tax=Methylobacterium radiotolerans (strain ATCC 27329 / DSM 1819 / JCM 2831 / NBRC 15690 / NCIMB 10815 / 0-1) TaxID=426355 RepID=B1MAC8_METRJ|nr:AAA family ATPase [Methylobacterium radiotolerans]ACB28453.1 Cobyrinic acid ac-diamide synthase [Methylobacterium radiotolerans JCM 2831]GEN01714.1 chromosome partitioning protein ParA [Methylobacterium radiotolerans]